MNKAPTNHLRQIALGVSLIALSVIGFFDFQNRLNNQAVASASTSLGEMSSDFTTLIASRTNVAELLSVGYRLLRAHQPQFATIALERARTLAPDSPDANLYLGWALLLTLDEQPIVEPESARILAQAKTAITEARRLNPPSEQADKLLDQIHEVEAQQGDQ